MKALIFNSGLGSRLGELTSDRPKAMVRLGNGETIFHRQLRILYSCGIREFVVTTGPYAEQLKEEARSFCESGCSVSFVANPVYDKTNYIFSMYLARDFLGNDDFIMLHGDLVFDAAYVRAVINANIPSLGSVNASLPRPEKDFKARINNGEVCEVSVSIFDDDCVTFQPFYKLSQEAMSIWLDAVVNFVETDMVNVYAENAANIVFDQMHVMAFSYEEHYVAEIDTPEDLEYVSREIRTYDFAQQPVYRIKEGESVELLDGIECTSLKNVGDLTELLNAFSIKKPFVVASSFFASWNISNVLEAYGDYVVFNDFQVNPTFENVLSALSVFKKTGCDSIISAGGGSAIDVAKCVKQMLSLPESTDSSYLMSKPLPYSSVIHVAMPSTAGTGSESTHFAVCYINGVKCSIANDCLLPDAVLLDASTLLKLPDYQKKCTMLDALCQAVESYWSVNSSAESRKYSTEAISIIMNYYEAYLSGDEKAAEQIMFASNRAGKAINLTTTTAPHAMSYKLTSLYHIPHGHAVALCMPKCWQYLLDHADKDLVERLIDISYLMTGLENCNVGDGLKVFREFYDSLSMPIDWKPKDLDDLDVLVDSVNIQRLSNFPIALGKTDIKKIYIDIMK